MDEQESIDELIKLLRGHNKVIFVGDGLGEVELKTADFIGVVRVLESIVRCKYCKYFRPEKNWCNNFKIWTNVKESNYCSRGRKKGIK